MTRHARGIPWAGRLCLAGAGALLLALSFPPFSLWFLAWFGLVPVILAAGNSPGRACAVGGLAGLALHAVVLSWLFSIAGMLYLFVAAYLACFWALFFFLVAGLPSRGKVFVCACAWVFIELVQRHLFSGFPWLPLSLSQTAHRSILPLAGLAGSAGISFLIVLSNLALSHGFRRQHRVSLVVAVGVFLFCVAAVRTAPSFVQPAGDGPTVVGIQPNIRASDRMPAAEVLLRLVRDTEQELPPDEHLSRALVIWPESSYPDFFLEEEEAVASVRALSRRIPATYCWILLGGLYRTTDGCFNAAFLVRRDGSVDIRAKRHLVPYGEYLPGRRYAFIRTVYQRLAGYLPFLSPGSDSTPVRIGGSHAGILICFENIFPDIVRESVRSGAEYLIVLTNDSWYGDGPFARSQHFSHNILRAAESSRHIVQVSLDGITGIASPHGETVTCPSCARGSACVFKTVVPRVCGQTLYIEFGDIPLFLLCLVVTGAALCRN